MRPMSFRNLSDALVTLGTSMLVSERIGLAFFLLIGGAPGAGLTVTDFVLVSKPALL